MSEEAGFEVARAFATITPDTSDFAALLDEQLGGLQLSVIVIPDSGSMANFAAAVDDGIGSMSATVGVGADTAAAEASVEDLLSEISSGRADLLVGANTGQASEAAQAAADEIGGLDTALNVSADTGGLSALPGELDRVQASAAAADSTLSGVEATIASLHSGSAVIGVTVVPDVTDFSQKLDEEAGGTVITVPVRPDTANFEAALEEELGGLGDTGGITIPVTVDTASAVSGLQDLEGAESDASASATSLAGDVGMLDDQFSGLQGRLSALDSAFSATAASGTATDAEMESIGARMEGLGLAFSAVGGELSAFREEAGAGGASAVQAGEQFQVMSSMLGELEGSLSAAEGAVRIVGTDFDAMASQVAAANERLNAANDMMGTVADAAPAAADAAGGLSGVLGELGGRLSYFAVDPFMWMYAAPMVIEGVASALRDLDGAGAGDIGMLTEQDKATGYNIAGYQKMAGQLAETAGQYAQSAQSMTDSTKSWGTDAGAVFSSMSDGMTQASQHASSEASNLAAHLQSLESAYSLTAPQAEHLATAAGVSAKQLAGSGAAADAAMAKVEAYGNANMNATGPVGQLSNDMMTFGDDALTATARVTGLDDAYQTLVGNFVSSQQASLAVQQDFLSIEASASIAGASMSGANTQSVSLQQSFYSTISAIEQTANAMVQQGDSTQQVSAYVQEQTDKLSLLTGGNQQAAQAVQGLQQWEDNLRGSTAGLDQELTQAADHMASGFVAQLKDAGAETPKVKTGVDDLTNSILNNGAQSAASENDRAQLIKDLEACGIGAQEATKLVDAFIRKIGQIPTHVNLTLTESAVGTLSITGSAAAGTAAATVTGGGGTRFTQHAGGGLIRGGSGHPRADDIHAMLSHGEYVVQAPAVSKYGTGLLDNINAMHFAEGGYAGDLSGLAGFIGAGVLNTASTLTQAVEAAVEAALAAADAKSGGSSKGSINVNYFGPQMPTPEQNQAMLMQLASAIGVS